jgi:6-pyruvoyltetrahydropterin/6-carboxytetrahydropterin synthase
MEKRLQISRKFFFSAAHRYNNPNWSETENLAKYGGAFHVHGHDYTLTCTLEGPVDPVTGLVVNLVDVDQVIKSVVGPLDQKPIHEVVPEFRTKIPSTENLVIYFYNQLQKKWPENVRLVKVRLEENEDLWAEYPVP